MELTNGLKESALSLESIENECNDIKGWIEIDIIDTGIGMNLEGMSKLFKPFSQASKAIQSQYGGTGLGLWITGKLVSLMKGKIRVKSKINKGTKFTIVLPVVAEFLKEKILNNLLSEESLEKNKNNKQIE